MTWKAFKDTNHLHYVVIDYHEGEYIIDVFIDGYDKSQRVTESLQPKPTTFCWWYDPSVVLDHEAVEMMRQAALEERQSKLKEIEGQIAALKAYVNPVPEEAI